MHFPAKPSEAPIVPTHVLDFMRGFAAVYVVVNHVRGAFFKGGARTLSEAVEPLGLYDYISIALLQATSLGTEFVILFFCVSGFAMAHSLAHNSSASGFYMRRAIRIWPPYVVAVALAALVCLLQPELAPDHQRYARCRDAFCTPDGLVAMISYVRVHTPITPQFWSLPYEVIFYALCPILLWRPKFVPAIFAISAICSAVGIGIYGPTLNPAPSMLVNFVINAMFWFMAGALAYQRRDLIPVLRPMQFFASSIALLLLVLAVKKFYGATNTLSSFMMILFAINCIRNLPHSLTSRKRWNWGFFSYSIYIFHYAIIVLIAMILEYSFGIDAVDISSYWSWMLVLPPVLLGCWAMYFVGERQSNEFLRRLRRKRSVVQS